MAKATYLCDDKLLYAVYASVVCDRPMLIEGAPGVGKTSLALSLAQGLGLPFIRCQMYDGLTADQILYDYDYQKQLLTLEAIRPKLEQAYADDSLSEAISKVVHSLDFYGEDFLIQRPVLRAIRTPGHKVLLFDEIDKASEEIEYMLYEFLENYAITIPQYGPLQCAPEDKPIVFLTSNSYRELSGAMKRRCNYIYMESKTREEMVQILQMKAGVNQKLADGVAQCLIHINSADVRYAPSIAEAIEFARFLQASRPLSKDMVLGALGILAKSHNDLNVMVKVVTEKGKDLWSS